MKFKNKRKLKIDPELRSRVLLVLLVLILVSTTIWISGPLPKRDSEGMIITPQTTITNDLLLTRNNKPVDILETTPTSGVTLAGLGVVVILLVGTFISLRSQKQSR